jgi:hypothetical protein
MPIIRDVEGRQRSIEWMRSVFGDVIFLEDPEAEFALHEVWCMCDPAAGLQAADDHGGFAGSAYGLTVKLFPFEQKVNRTAEVVDPGAVIVVRVEDEIGRSLANVDVARWWPDPGLPLLPEHLATWKGQGVYGTTGGSGDTGFGMGKGDYYPPGQRPGASCVWPEDGEGLANIGMVEATSHWTVWPVFRRRSDTPIEPPPEEPPVEPPVVDDFQMAVIRGFEEVKALLAEILDALL